MTYNKKEKVNLFKNPLKYGKSDSKSKVYLLI